MAHNDAGQRHVVIDRSLPHLIDGKGITQHNGSEEVILWSSIFYLYSSFNKSQCLKQNSSGGKLSMSFNLIVIIFLQPPLSNHQLSLVPHSLKALMLKPENQVCSDCPERQPRWASLIVPPPGAPAGSLPMGAFCCLECSGSHRRLGVHISFVRSVNLDQCKSF